MDKFSALLCGEIAKYLHIDKLNQHDQEYVIKCCRKIDMSSFSNYTIPQLLHALSTVIGKKIQSLKIKPVDIPFDMHSYQTQHLISDGDDGDDAKNPATLQAIKITSFLGIGSISELKLLVNPDSMYEHYYVVLDSDYRNTSQENPLAITQFTWDYSPTQNTGIGFCNSIGNVHNIVGMRMCQPRIPYLAAMNTSAKRVSVLVRELLAQAFITEIGSRFHFLLRPKIVVIQDIPRSQSSVELTTEDYNDGIFTFYKPITQFSSQTLIFGDPINTLTFSVPFDRFVVAIEYTCIKDLVADY